MVPRRRRFPPLDRNEYPDGCGGDPNVCGSFVCPHLKLGEQDRRHGKAQHKVVSRVEPNINGEADYIISKAQIHASRVVRLGPLVLFSTHTGDAWILDPEDNLALCLAQGGERQTFSILETHTNFQIAWEAEYHIDGETFTVYTNDGRAKTILGYPTREIESAIEAGG